MTHFALVCPSQPFFSGGLGIWGPSDSGTPEAHTHNPHFL